MPTADDLVGLGVQPTLASAIGNQPNSLGCLGTTQGTAAVIKTHNTELVPSSSQTGAVFQAAAKVGTPHYFFNAQSTSAVIYVQTGDSLQGTVNGTFTLAQNKAAILMKYKVSGTAGLWSVIIST